MAGSAHPAVPDPPFKLGLARLRSYANLLTNSCTIAIETIVPSEDRPGQFVFLEQVPEPEDRALVGDHVLTNGYKARRTQWEIVTTPGSTPGFWLCRRC